MSERRLEPWGLSSIPFAALRFRGFAPVGTKLAVARVVGAAPSIGERTSGDRRSAAAVVIETLNRDIETLTPRRRSGMPTLKGQSAVAGSRSSRLPEMSWNAINDSGCYLLVDSGELVRIPPEVVAPGHSPLVTITATKETRVAKLSDNAAEPISVLRAIAADNDYFVNF
jgi:hypothetical protein